MPKWFSPRVSTTTRTTNSLVTSTGLAGPAVSETLCGSVRSLSNQRLSQNGSPLNSSPGITTVCVTSSHRFSCFSASKLSANIPRPPGSLQLLPVPMRFAYSFSLPLQFVSMSLSSLLTRSSFDCCADTTRRTSTNS
jgi:hypothetical protein